MEYESIKMVGEYIQWMIGIAIAIITFRGGYIIYSMSTSLEENISLNAIFTKVGKHVKALVIAVCAEVIIEVFQQYFFH